MVCMEVTVIFPAQPIVKKVRVTFKMEVAIHVVMDGPEYIVKMNVRKDGTVQTVANNVMGIVKVVLPVIT